MTRHKPLLPSAKGIPKIPIPIKREWSASSMKDFYNCPRGWYLEKIITEKSITPALAKGIHVHRGIENLRLHHLRKRARYKSAEAFGNVLANDWGRNVVKEGEIDGRKIIWEFDEQPYIIKEEIRKIGHKHYPILMEEGPPILIPIYKNGEKPIQLDMLAIMENKPQPAPKKHREYKTAYFFEFRFKGRGLRGEIDEFRPNFLVRDYKTGIWKFIEKKLEYDLQPTIYLLAISNLLLTNEELRSSLNITEAETKELEKDPNYIKEKVKFEYYMLDPYKEWDKKQQKMVEIERNPRLPTPRSNFQVKNLVQRIDYADYALAGMNDVGFYPAFEETCQKCPYYKNFKHECQKMTERSDIERKQLLLYDLLKNPPQSLPDRPLIEEAADSQNQAKSEFITRLESSKS